MWQLGKLKIPVLPWALLATALCSIVLILQFPGRASGVTLSLVLAAIGFCVGSQGLHIALFGRTPSRSPSPLPLEILDIVESQLVSPGKDIEQVRSIISDAAGQLSTSFTDLSRMIQSQQESLRLILNEIKGDSDAPEGDLKTDTVTIARLVSEMAETAALIGRFVRIIVAISKQSMDLYYCVEDVSEHLKGVVRLVDDVKSIAYQTTILALNAAIEAARAGEAGVTFQVVAGEVRALAERSKLVSEQITEQVQQAGKAVASARTITELNASQDLGVLLTSKIRIDAMGLGIGRLDQTLREKLDSVSDISAQIASKTALSIQGLQFEDIARQILERCQHDLEGLQSTVRSVRERAGNSSGEADSTDSLAALAQTLIADQEAKAQHKPTQETVTAGDIELF